MFTDPTGNFAAQTRAIVLTPQNVVAHYRLVTERPSNDGRIQVSLGHTHQEACTCTLKNAVPLAHMILNIKY